MGLVALERCMMMGKLSLIWCWNNPEVTTAFFFFCSLHKRDSSSCLSGCYIHIETNMSMIMLLMCCAVYYMYVVDPNLTAKVYVCTTYWWSNKWLGLTELFVLFLPWISAVLQISSSCWLLPSSERRVSYSSRPEGNVLCFKLHTKYHLEALSRIHTHRDILIWVNIIERKTVKHILPRRGIAL